MGTIPTWTPEGPRYYSDGGIIRPPLPPDPMPRLDAQLSRIEGAENLLRITQDQLFREIGARQALESRVGGLEALVKELAKSQLGVDID